MSGPRIALFGPQVTQWTPQGLADLQSSLTQNPKLGFLAEALAQLPSLWPLLEGICSTSGFHGEEKLRELAAFAKEGRVLDPRDLTNTQLAPLTIVSQVLDLTSRVRGNTFLDFAQSAQGFCIGFLTAAAFASSTSWEVFERNVSNALRLAVCIGTAVDTEDVSRGPGDRAIALGVRWKAYADRANLDACLDRLPDAYISCVCDEALLTITLRKGDQARFSAQLQQANMTSIDIGLGGSYHHPKHWPVVRTLKQLCDQNQQLQLPHASQLRLPLRSTADTDIIHSTAGPLHAIALDLILCKRAHWFQTVQQAMSTSPPAQPAINLVAIGLDAGVIPRSLLPGTAKHQAQGPIEHMAPKADEIAVIGMACRFPQADSLDEFWRLLRGGGTSFGRMPVERFDTADITREPKLQGDFWGNFLRNPDAFDHRFFNISGREAKSMDPQQRLVLQVAYEALETAGYHALPTSKQPTDVGCYLGVGAVEYEDNIAGEDANAFSALGMLRAFISGRISHFFGWTGPSLTVDTACSSSAVAIHTACRALLGGECSLALAGGINIITSPTLHQNLAAGSFLDPTGRSKAFDVAAGGYCRGEGAGILVLKPLSRAVADGDTILGVIAGSAVNQNSNCSPITVPESSSQSSLYKRVLEIGGMRPEDVTYVEAHGTGTQVGDPKEYESVRLALGSPSRTEELFLGSVKDNIGHCEAASGVAGVIKTLLMLQHKTIPKQASFVTLNPRIKALPSDRIIVPKTTQPWAAQRRVALVNNYGAAGSNAAILLREYQKGGDEQPLTAETYPILLSAKTPAHLQSYVRALKSFLPTTNASLASIAYNLARRQNISFQHRVAFTATDRESLLAALDGPDASPTQTEKQPIVLAFGGQTGRTVTISRELYDNCHILQQHLDNCDAACRTLGLPSIFPAIFHGEPVDDVVTLHCMLLSLQVSSARTWIDTGLEVDTLVGHSFGHLAALVVAGSISLQDGFRFVAGRARLIRDSWGQDPGAMLSVDCDNSGLKAVVDQVNSTPGCRIDIACYNSSRTFVLAGDAASVNEAESLCRSWRLKAIRLQNTHAYHSYLADLILPGLRVVAESISITPPRIRIETCTAARTWTRFTAEELVQHTREPVYFAEAVGRITSRLPSAVWIEAGSASPIIAMTRRIIGAITGTDTPGRCSHVFIPMELGVRDSMASLARAACQLWKAGSASKGWHFHRSSHHQFSDISLPPYQFDMTRHWIKYKYRSTAAAARSQRRAAHSGELVERVGGGEGSSSQHLFVVNTANAFFQLATRGHAVAGQALCPASLYLEIAARCAMAIADQGSQKLPHVERLAMSAPLGMTSESTVLLSLKNQDQQGGWEFSVFSQPSSVSNHQVEDCAVRHAQGLITLVPAGDIVAESRLKLLNKVFRSSQAERILNLPAASGIRGPMVYSLFSSVVNYADYYRGVSSLFAHENQAAGLVSLPPDNPPGLDPGACDPVSLDNFLQVAGIHVNCLSPRKEGQVFMCTEVEEVVFSPKFHSNRKTSSPAAWTVYTRYEMISASELANDICVYDAESSELVVAIMGATFKSVPLKSLERNLARLNGIATKLETRPTLPASDNSSLSEPQPHDSGYQTPISSPPVDESRNGIAFAHRDQPSSTVVVATDGRVSSEPPKPQVHPRSHAPETVRQLREMFSNIIEVPITDVRATSTLDELGVDSLLATEVLAEIQKRFQVTITQTQLRECADVLRLSQLLQPTEPAEPAPQAGLDLDNGYDSGVEGLSSDDYSSTTSEKLGQQSPNLAIASRECFASAKTSYDQHAIATGFSDFCAEVYPLQSQLVTQYVVTAFASLGCDLGALGTGDELPSFYFDPRHTRLIPQLQRILRDSGLITQRNTSSFRTAVPAPAAPIQCLHEEMLARFPKHASETKLLHTTGAKLADCLTGREDPIGLIFRDAEARSLLEDVYTNAPMFKTGTLLLADYLSSVITRVSNSRRTLRILELGAGTGGTTKHIVESLASLGSRCPFTYTFTDLSPSLVTAAKRKFARWSSFMEYATLNIEDEPAAHLLGAYDIIISTNCIHATRDLVQSTTHIRKMLRPDGVLCLVELTRNLFWFDLVFGLLEGWWLFTDGREHALAHEERWSRDLRKAGFKWVDWSGTTTKESDILRLITASPFAVEVPLSLSDPVLGNGRESGRVVGKETMTFKTTQGTDLLADIYYPPPERISAGRKSPVALMIHGGGHIMLSRDDIRPEQTEMLLRSGFIPISIDYRLCPETTLVEGPMTDVADAMAWIRTVLPNLHLARPDIRIDGERVVAVGWSTGAHLAMTLSWTSLEAGVQPPEAILAFYGPTDYEDPFWKRSNIPRGSESPSLPPGTSAYELDEQVWSGIFDRPATRYNVPPEKRALGGWMAQNDPRSRLALHMNWHGRTLHVLLGGLDKKKRLSPGEPSADAVAAVSPLARVRRGEYRTPTFIIHPREDDLIPWEQADRTWKHMLDAGVDAELRIVDGMVHLFDVAKGWQRNEAARRAVEDGYAFLCRYAGVTFFS